MAKVLDRKLIVTANFTHLGQDALLDKMQAIVTNMTNHSTDFPNPSPTTTEVSARVTAQRSLRDQIQVLRKQQQSLTQQYRQQANELVTIFVNHWVPYVQQQADGDAAKVLETGFGIKGNEDGKGEHSRLASYSDSYPIATQIDTQTRLQHILYFINSNTSRRAKPYDVERIEIFDQVGEARPQGVEGMRYAGSTRNSTFVNRFDPEDAGKTVYYAFRYVSTRNQMGTESPVQSAIVTS
jgi:hypothetical protein